MPTGLHCRAPTARRADDTRHPVASVCPNADGAGVEVDIHIERHRGATRLTVQWLGSQAAHCAAWLGEVAAAL